jgi:four helix bundle protein
MRTHRDLIAWQKARANALAIHRLCENIWTPTLRSVLDQLRRASLSVPLNIAEGNASGRGRRCRYLIHVAYASAVETTELLDFLRELGVAVGPTLDDSREVQAVTLGLWRSLRP